jgi:hypothetical protein
MTTIKLGYRGKYFSELIKVKNFPKLDIENDKMMWCEGKKWKKFLQNNIELTCILNKIGNEVFNQKYNLYKDMYCSFQADGNFSSELKEAYIYVDGESSVHVVDDVNKFNGGKEWVEGINEWKKIKC